MIDDLIGRIGPRPPDLAGRQRDGPRRRRLHRYLEERAVGGDHHPGRPAEHPEELYEAARVDGASAWRTFLSVILPQLLPLLLTLTIFIAAYRVLTFDIVYGFTQGGPAARPRCSPTRSTSWPSPACTTATAPPWRSSPSRSCWPSAWPVTRRCGASRSRPVASSMGPAGSPAARGSAARGRCGAPLLFYAPIALFLLVTVAPIYWIVLSAFTPIDELFTIPLSYIPRHPSLVNFERVAQIVPLARQSLNSTLLAGASSAVSVLVSMLAAYAFARLRFPGRGTLLMALLLSGLLPSVATIIPAVPVVPEPRPDRLAAGHADPAGEPAAPGQRVAADYLHPPDPGRAGGGGAGRRVRPSRLSSPLW